MDIRVDGNSGADTHPVESAPTPPPPTQTDGPAASTGGAAETAGSAGGDNTVRAGYQRDGFDAGAAGSSRAPLSVNTFEAKSVSGPTPMKDGQGDEFYDGALVGADGKAYDPKTTSVDDVPAIEPRPGAAAPTGQTVVHVNGIWTTKQQAVDEAQAIADKTGNKVVVVYNATSGGGDVVQAITDTQLAQIVSNKATDTLTNVIYDKVKQDKPINVSGYSQGGIIVSNALRNVKNKLYQDDGGFLGNLFNDKGAKRDEKLGRISVETYGSAAGDFPDGPNYTHYINSADKVPVLFGLHGKWSADIGLSHPGKDAKIIEFSTPASDPLDFLTPHLIDKYLAQHVPNPLRNEK